MAEAGNHHSSTSIGARLQSAREAKGLSLEDIATKTRIPIRHLTSIEEGDWEALPAPTYSVGFARSYANAVGLNGAEIGQEVRNQVSGAQRTSTAAAHYEPADPARVPPRSLALVAAAIALILIIGYAVWRNAAIGGEDLAEETAAPAPAQPAAPPPAQPAPVSGPVVLTAIEDVWLRVYEGNGGPRLLERTLTAGERYEVPATATAPQILTGRPDALRVTVGTTEIPQLGPAQRTISDVSLKAADLLARVGASDGEPPATATAAQ